MAAQNIHETWDIVSRRAGKLFRAAMDENRSPEQRAKAARIWKALADVASRLSIAMIEENKRRYPDIRLNGDGKAVPLIQRPEYIIPPSLRK